MNASLANFLNMKKCSSFFLCCFFFFSLTCFCFLAGINHPKSNSSSFSTFPGFRFVMGLFLFLDGFGVGSCVAVIHIGGSLRVAVIQVVGSLRVAVIQVIGSLRFAVINLGGDNINGIFFEMSDGNGDDQLSFRGNIMIGVHNSSFLMHEPANNNMLLIISDIT